MYFYIYLIDMLLEELASNATKSDSDKKLTLDVSSAQVRTSTDHEYNRHVCTMLWCCYGVYYK